MVKTGLRLDYKQQVLELTDLVRTGKANVGLLEFRLSLFAAASLSGTPSQCLHPFPTFLRTGEAGEHIRRLPALGELTQTTDLPELTWKLLHWILTYEFNVCPLFYNEMDFHVVLAELIQQKIGLEFPLNYFMFEVRVPNPNPAFVAGKERHGSFFAFHGSPLHNFHSIAHRGLLSCLNTRSAYGHGTYVSTEFGTSLGYAGASGTWDKSVFGENQHCLAICEVVNAPHGHGLTKHGTVTVVADDNLIQLAYLLLFAPNYVQRSAGNRVHG